MNNLFLYQKIYAKIRAAEKILFVTHEKPDGDALGSICAMMELAENLGKSYSAYCADAPAPHFRFLPHVEKILSDKNAFNFADYDLIIALDCGDRKRTKLTDEIATRKKSQFVISIDHHPKVDDFADLEIKNPLAASTSELVYELFKANKIKINKNAANSILTGISADTANFIFPATTDRTVKISSELLSRGANLPQIIEQTWRNKSLSALKIWGQAMSNLEINKKYNLAFTVLAQNDIVSAGISEDELEGIANFLSSLHDAPAVLLLREQTNGTIKGSLRATQADTDVSQLARALGGGGHTKAAGFMIEGKLEKTEKGWTIV